MPNSPPVNHPTESARLLEDLKKKLSGHSMVVERHSSTVETKRSHRFFGGKIVWVK